MGERVSKLFMFGPFSLFNDSKAAQRTSSVMFFKIIHPVVGTNHLQLVWAKRPGRAGAQEFLMSPWHYLVAEKFGHTHPTCSGAAVGRTASAGCDAESLLLSLFQL